MTIKLRFTTSNALKVALHCLEEPNTKEINQFIMRHYGNVQKAAQLKSTALPADLCALVHERRELTWDRWLGPPARSGPAPNMLKRLSYACGVAGFMQVACDGLKSLKHFCLARSREVGQDGLTMSDSSVSLRGWQRLLIKANAFI